MPGDESTEPSTTNPLTDPSTTDPSTTDSLTVALIVAVAENGVIGRDGGMAWHYPADLRHFKETTMGHPVIMGRVTYESIVEGLGHPLPGRTSVVLTSQDREYPEDVVAVDSIENALEVAREDLAVRDRDDATVFVAGGGSVYEQFLPVADRLYWTEIHETYEGDTYFPEVDWDDWSAVERDDHEELSFVVYDRSS